MHHSKSGKGQGTTFLILLIGVLLAVMILASMFIFQYRGGSLKNQLALYIEADDRGRELVSFLHVAEDGVSNLERAGNMFALWNLVSDYSKYKEEALALPVNSRIKDSAQNIGVYMWLYNSTQDFPGFGKRPRGMSSEDVWFERSGTLKYETQIPIPGAGKGGDISGNALMSWTKEGGERI